MKSNNGPLINGSDPVIHFNIYTESPKLNRVSKTELTRETRSAVVLSNSRFRTLSLSEALQQKGVCVENKPKPKTFK